MEFQIPLIRKAPLRDIVEAMGVPRTEIGSMRSGDEEFSFKYIPATSMDLSIYPLIPPVDVRVKTILRPAPFSSLLFIVDENVAKLASLLRILGIDAWYFPGITDSELADIAWKNGRTVLSKDIRLFKRNKIIYGRFIRALDPMEQFREVIGFFKFHKPFSLFTRCLECNTLLAPVSKASILHLLEPKTIKYFDEFKTCPSCDKIFWKGSHYDHMVNELKSRGIVL